MKRIRVNASVKYDVVVGRSILNVCGELIKEVINPCTACIITDDTVANLYLPAVKKSLQSSGFKILEFIFPSGETSKNSETLISAVSFMANNFVTRSDVVIALGGGVVGDLAGFAAATYQRGIRFVQIPTTFLADIDSSVGGKTAVNLDSGKNLWGAFHQPSMVVCDTECLKTLKHETFLDGVAEAVKYAVLCDESIISLINSDIDTAVCRCVEIKRNIVNSDEFETGERKLLNLGHTLGHSIEKLSNFSVTHGHAVAIGTVIASRGGERMGITEEGTTEKIINVMKKFGLPVDSPYSAKELAACAMGDKKREGDEITLVIPERIGKCRLSKVNVSELEKFAEM